MLELLFKFKKYIIGALLAVALFVGHTIYVSHKERVAYNKGFAEANTAWMNKGREYVDMLNEQLSVNRDLNNQVNKTLVEKKVAEDLLKKKINSGVIEYNKTDKATQNNIDDRFVELYNESLGGK